MAYRIKRNLTPEEAEDLLNALLNTAREEGLNDLADGIENAIRNRKFDEFTAMAYANAFDEAVGKKETHRLS